MLETPSYFVSIFTKPTPIISNQRNRDDDCIYSTNHMHLLTSILSPAPREIRNRRTCMMTHLAKLTMMFKTGMTCNITIFQTKDVEKCTKSLDN